MMNPEIKQKWIDALRSGKYKQTDSALATLDGYCCLGVACEVFATEARLKKSGPDSDGDYSYNGETAYLPPSLAEYMGIDWRGTLLKPVGGKATLAELNDEVGYTFEQIADVIEEQL